MISRGTATIEYNVSNKPTKIGDMQFWYDSNDQKLKQQTATAIAHFYANGAYEEEKTVAS